MKWRRGVEGVGVGGSGDWRLAGARLGRIFLLEALFFPFGLKFVWEVNCTYLGLGGILHSEVSLVVKCLTLLT